VSATNFNGNDSIVGGVGNDTINGGAGNDTILGGAGDDLIIGGGGANSLIGGSGSDTFVYANAAHVAGDTVDGGAGDTDVIRLDAGGTYNFTTATVSNIEQVAVNANAAMTITLSDNFNDDNANVEIVNTTGAAVTANLTIDASAFTGGTGALNVSATNFNGNDSIVGGVGNDTINGGAGNDTILSGHGNDSILGGDGNDIIWGGQGIDTVNTGTGLDRVIVVGNLAGSTAGKMTLINDTLNALIGYNPGLMDTYTSDVASGGSLIFDSSGNDELHAFGDVDLTNVDITGDFVLYTYSTLTLTEAQLSQAKEIVVVGDHNHSIFIRGNAGQQLGNGDQGVIFDIWLDQAGRQLRFEAGAQKIFAAGDQYEFQAAGGRNTGEDLKALQTGTTPAGSPIGATPNSSSLALETNPALNNFTSPLIVSTGRTSVDILPGYRLTGAQFVSSFEPGTTFLPVPNTFLGVGDNKVHNRQFEVYYGDYDIRTGIFSVTNTPSNAAQTKYTLILYDNDTSNLVQFVEGIVFANYMTERQWVLANGGTSTANLSFPQGNIISGGAYNSVFGTDGNNVLNGSGSSIVDYLYGRDGDDTITGYGGGDFIIAGTGADFVTPGFGANIVDLGKRDWPLVGDQNVDILVINAQAGFASDSMWVAAYGTGPNTVRKSGEDYVFNFEVDLDIIRIVATAVGNFNHNSNAFVGDATWEDNTLLVDLNDNGSIGAGDVAVTFRELGIGVTMNTDRVQYNITATNSNNLIVGGMLGDTIRGGSGNDTIEGGGGADSLSGGAGNDVFRFGAGEFIAGDSVDGGEGTDTLLLTANSQVIGDSAFANKSRLEAFTTANGNNSITLAGTATGAFSEVTVTITGGDGDDTINLTGFGRSTSVIGGNGNDTIILGSGSGASTMRGGLGDDVYIFSRSAISGDLVVEYGSQGADTIRVDGSFDLSSLSSTSFANIEHLFVNGAYTVTLNGWSVSGQTFDVQGLTGSVQTIVIEGKGIGQHTDLSGISAGANWTDGVDIITINGANGSNGQITGTQMSDIIFGGTGDERINGGAGNDTITGGLGNDSINAGSGANIIHSGVGLDFVTVDQASTNTVNLSLGGAGNLTTVVVTAGTNFGTTIQTGALHDVTNVQATAAGSTVGVVMTAAAATGSTTVNFTGGTGNDIIIGGSGNDTISGGGGADILDGGAGADVFEIATISDLHDLLAIYGGANAGGVDVVRLFEAGTYASGLFDKLDSIERIALWENADWNLTFGNTPFMYTDANGDGFVDKIIEIVAAVGMTGNVTINASAVTDGGRLVVGSASGLSFDGNDSFVGGSGADTIFGGAGNDTITGGGGNDVINAGSGTNVITDAGTGDDTIIHDAAESTVDIGVTDTGKVTLNASQLGAVVHTAIGVDAHVIATGSTADLALNGNTGNDTLVGGSGNDTITGGGGADSLDGGDGDDVFVFADNVALRGVVTVIGGSGIDTIRFTDQIDTLTHGSAQGSNFSDDFAKVSDVSVIELIGANKVNLGTPLQTAGISTVVIGEGDTTLRYDFALLGHKITVDARNLADNKTLTLIEEDFFSVSEFSVINLRGDLDASNLSMGVDVSVASGVGFDVLIVGGGGNDTLIGGSGNDTISGGGGLDVLTGGSGSDLFSFTGISSSADRNVVTDFSFSGDVDVVGLDRDFTGPNTAAGSQAVFTSHVYSVETGGNTPAYDYAIGLQNDAFDIIEITGLDQSRGDLSAANNGSELLKMFETTTSGTEGVGTLQFAGADATPVKTYLLAYDDGKAFLYLANSADRWVVADEIRLVGTFDGVTTGAFDASHFVMVPLPPLYDPL